MFSSSSQSLGSRQTSLALATCVCLSMATIIFAFPRNNNNKTRLPNSCLRHAGKKKNKGMNAPDKRVRFADDQMRFQKPVIDGDSYHRTRKMKRRRQSNTDVTGNSMTRNNRNRRVMIMPAIKVSEDQSTF